MDNSESLRIGLVTGCGKGIGLAITKKLLREKNQLVLGISKSKNIDLELLIKKHEENFIFYEVDISDTNFMRKIIRDFQNQYGLISFAICNAGVRSRMPLLESDLDLYRKILEINTISNINIAKELINVSIYSKKKCNILFISSIVGYRGFKELSTYAVSKSALEGFMKSAAIEFAKDNIQLNCLAPGFVESSYASDFKKNKKELYKWTIEQTPMGRWGKCDEIAELALFLVSEKNSYMTGSIIYSDGGWNAK